MRAPGTVAKIAAVSTVLVLAAVELPDLAAEPERLSTPAIICRVFRSHCREALRVAWCESRWRIYARNGQYLGVFQMGRAERARFGFAWNAWTQARAARRYYRLAGWQPWTCKP